MLDPSKPPNYHQITSNIAPKHPRTPPPENPQKTNRKCPKKQINKSKQKTKAMCFVLATGRQPGGFLEKSLNFCLIKIRRLKGGGYMISKILEIIYPPL